MKSRFSVRISDGGWCVYEIAEGVVRVSDLQTREEARKIAREMNAGAAAVEKAEKAEEKSHEA